MKLRILKEAYPQYEMGEGSYGDLALLGFDDATKISVGKYCSFAFGVKALLGGEHRADWTTTYPFSALWPEAKDIGGHPWSKGHIRIGNDVWVGAEAMILSGVTIGDGAVIAARTVVHKDVPAYAIVGGSPAKLIDYRFAPDVVARLERVRWWDWPRERIVKALPLMLSSAGPKEWGVVEFLNAVDAGKI